MTPRPGGESLDSRRRVGSSNTNTSGVENPMIAINPDHPANAAGGARAHGAALVTANRGAA
jgi:hypothetical protein